MVFRQVENGIASQKIESRYFYYLKIKVSPWSLSSPTRQRQITHSPQLRGRTVKTYFEMYCLKSTFFKTCDFLLEAPFAEFEQKPGGYNY